jgi:hypothetical protein
VVIAIPTLVSAQPADFKELLFAQSSTNLVVGVGEATNPGTGCEVVEMAKETSGARKTSTL